MKSISGSGDSVFVFTLEVIGWLVSHIFFVLCFAVWKSSIQRGTMYQGQSTMVAAKLAGVHSHQLPVGSTIIQLCDKLSASYFLSFETGLRSHLQPQNITNHLPACSWSPSNLLPLIREPVLKEDNKSRCALTHRHQLFTWEPMIIWWDQPRWHDSIQQRI